MGTCALSYRRRKVEAVFGEMENAIQNAEVRFIDFEDENLSLDKPWFMQLLRMISKRWPDLPLELRAMNGLFPPSLDEAMVAAMKTAGFRTLNLSLATTAREQLIRFRRPDVTLAVTNALKWAEKYDLTAVCYIIVGAPGQKAIDSVRDLVFLCRYRVLAGVSGYYPAPGSEDFETAATRGLLPEHLMLMRSSAIPLSDTTTRLETVTLLRLGRVVNFIKSIVDTGQPLPAPCRLHSGEYLPVQDRFALGIRLLQAFLHDGKFRGITPDGEIYEHRTATALTRLFIHQLQAISIRGITYHEYQN
jgi:hypothetical protein